MRGTSLQTKRKKQNMDMSSQRELHLYAPMLASVATEVQQAMGDLRYR